MLSIYGNDTKLSQMKKIGIAIVVSGIAIECYNSIYGKKSKKSSEAVKEKDSAQKDKKTKGN